MNSLRDMSAADLAALCDCKHDRASHWDGAGQCGWCPCATYAPAPPPQPVGEHGGELLYDPDQLAAWARNRPRAA